MNPTASPEEGPPRPAPSVVDLDAIPEALTERRQWVCWVHSWNGRKWTKVPIRPDGRAASSTDRGTWHSFDEVAVAYGEAGCDGIGFVLTPDDPFACLDLDGCVTNGKIHPTAQGIIDQLDSFTEWSQSATGVHVWIVAHGHPTRRRKGKFELYAQERFIAVTGRSLPGTRLSIEPRQPQIDEIAEAVFGPDAPSAPQAASVSVNLDDRTLLERMFAAQNGDAVRRLWEGDTSAHNGDDSAADMALMAHLRFWTGNDPDHMEHLFSQSALGQREKWQSRRDYRTRTVEAALRLGGEVYSPRAAPTNGLHPEPWPSPVELPSPRPSVPSLPPELVPDPLRGWLSDIAERASIPLEFPTIPAVIAAGAVVGRSIGIAPNRFDDFVTVCNLWGGIVGRPGLMKTHAIQEATRPVHRIEAKAREQHALTANESEAHKARIEAEIEALKTDMRVAARNARRNSGDQETAPISELEAQLAAKNGELVGARGPRRYTTQDATVEKLGELLTENPRGLLIIRDELAGWLRTLDRQGREGDREFYLESWNGTGSFSVDRIGRGSIHVSALTLSVCGGIQPGVLDQWIREALADGRGADGLIQRLQLSVYPDSLGEWKRVDRWPDSGLKDRAYRVYERLDSLKSGDLEATVDDRGIPYLRFDDEGQELVDVWRDELERRLRSPELEASPAFESHVAKFRSLMPKLALLFRLIAITDGERPSKPGLRDCQLAATWCEFLEAHARKLYAAELNAGNEAAHLLLKRIKSGEIKDCVTVREIYRRGWSGLAMPSAVEEGLRTLAVAGWVRLDPQPTGGRPTDIVRLNPVLTGAAR